MGDIGAVGTLLLGVAAVIVAIGGIVLPYLTLKQTQQVHTLVNSAASVKDDALIRSNELLATALTELFEERRQARETEVAARQATLERSQEAISSAEARAPAGAG